MDKSYTISRKCDSLLNKCPDGYFCDDGTACRLKTIARSCNSGSNKCPKGYECQNGLACVRGGSPDKPDKPLVSGGGVVGLTDDMGATLLTLQQGCDSFMNKCPAGYECDGGKSCRLTRLYRSCNSANLKCPKGYQCDGGKSCALITDKTTTTTPYVVPPFTPPIDPLWPTQTPQVWPTPPTTPWQPWPTPPLDTSTPSPPPSTGSSWTMVLIIGVPVGLVFVGILVWYFYNKRKQQQDQYP